MKTLGRIFIMLYLATFVGAQIGCVAYSMWIGAWPLCVLLAMILVASSYAIWRARRWLWTYA